MTEARIRVLNPNKDIVEFNSLISHENQRERKLSMFDPPVEIRHGKHHDDNVELIQGKNVQLVYPGEITIFFLDKKTIEVTHTGESRGFKDSNSLSKSRI